MASPSKTLDDMHGICQALTSPPTVSGKPPCEGTTHWFRGTFPALLFFPQNWVFHGCGGCRAAIQVCRTTFHVYCMATHAFREFPVGYKCHGSRHLPSKRQWLSIGSAPWKRDYLRPFRPCMAAWLRLYNGASSVPSQIGVGGKDLAVVNLV